MSRNWTGSGGTSAEHRAGADLEAMGSETIEVRLARAAEAALAENGYVSLIDVLVGMGWLAPVRVGEWRQGRLPTLEQAIQVDPAKLSAAAGLFGKWASSAASSRARSTTCRGRGIAGSFSSRRAGTPASNRRGGLTGCLQPYRNASAATSPSVNLAHRISS